MDFKDIIWVTFYTTIVLLILGWIFIPKVKFKLRIGLYNLSLIWASIIAIPIMMKRGRNVKNLATISWITLNLKHVFGIKIKVHGYHNMIQDKPCVIVSNHQSSLDLLGMAQTFPPRSTFLAKHELLYTGPLGLALWLAGGVFINRKNHKNSKEVLHYTSETLLKDRLKIWIFPEGTRSKKQGMLPFKLGAFNIAIESQVPVVPVVYKSYKNFYCPAENRFCPGTCEMFILEPISTDNLTIEDVPNLSDRVREKMLEVYNS